MSVKYIIPQNMEKTTAVPAEILALPLELRAEMAFRVAVKKAVDEYARDSMTLSIWRDNKVVEASAEQMREYLV